MLSVTPIYYCIGNMLEKGTVNGGSRPGRPQAICDASFARSALCCFAQQENFVEIKENGVPVVYYASDALEEKVLDTKID